jgi:hypothetical protein
MIKRKMENKILTIGVGTTVLLTSMVLALGTPHAYAQSHYQIGYDDGCAGRVVSGHHTSEYLSGYADGSKACHNTQVSEHNSVVSPSQNTANANNNDNSARQTVIINNK